MQKYIQFNFTIKDDEELLTKVPLQAVFKIPVDSFDTIGSNEDQDNCWKYQSTITESILADLRITFDSLEQQGTVLYYVDHTEDTLRLLDYEARACKGTIGNGDLYTVLREIPASAPPEVTAYICRYLHGKVTPMFVWDKTLQYWIKLR